VTLAVPADRFKALSLALLLVMIVSGLAGVLLLACWWICCRLLGLWFEKRAGGVTGDLLGGCCEVIETGVLIACAACGNILARLVPAGIVPI